VRATITSVLESAFWICLVAAVVSALHYALFALAGTVEKERLKTMVKMELKIYAVLLTALFLAMYIAVLVDGVI